MAEKDDPFVSIIDQCKYSSSQEDLLRYCLFCRESQEGLVPFSSQESSLPEELEVASTGLIICSPPDSQPEELQVASQGLLICYPPGSQPEEEFQTPEERLLVSSEEQWMDLDEHLESKIDGVDGDAIDAVDDASPDLAGTVDLGKDSYLNFSEENSTAGNGSQMPRAVHVDGDDESVSLVEKSSEGKVPIEILPLQECLGVPEPMSEGLDDTLSKNLKTSEMNLQLLVVDNVDSSVGRSREIYIGGVADQTIEPPVEKNLGSLKSWCNSPSMSSPKSPQKSQKIATYENVDDVNAHPDMYFEKGDMLIVHPVTHEVEYLEIAVGNNNGVQLCCTEAVMEDALPIAIEKGLVPEINTEKVLDLDNPQTDVGKRGGHNMEGLGEVEKTGSSDISPESEDPPGLRRLPNWVGVKDNAMGNLRQSGKRRVGEAERFNQSGINKVGEVEGSGCGGGGVGEVDGIDCGAWRVEEADRLDAGRRLGEGTGLGHGGKKTAGEAGCSSTVTEALSSGNEYDAMMNLLAATFLRENNRNTGSGCGGGRVEEVGGSYNAGRKLGEGKGSGLHGKETARITGIGHGGGRVEEVEGSHNAERRSGKGKGPSSHGKKTARSKGSGCGGGRVEEADGSDNAGRRLGEGKGSDSQHGKKAAGGEAEGSSRVTSALSSGNQSQAMMNLLTASFLRETNVNKGNADNSNENSQNTEDILEVAIRAGLKFPRPRWWKPEGYETKRDN